MDNIDEQKKMENTLKTVVSLVAPADKSQGIVAMLKPQFVECNYENKTLTVAFPVQEWELNPMKIMHGGLITTAFDTSFGILSHYFAQDKVINTVDISTFFLKPVPSGDTLLVSVKTNSFGRTILNLTAEARLESNGILAATAVSTFMILNKTLVL